MSIAADTSSKMRAENYPLDSGIQRSLVTLARALSIERGVQDH